MYSILIPAVVYHSGCQGPKGYDNACRSSVNIFINLCININYFSVVHPTFPWEYEKGELIYSDNDAVLI
jgi:hypothetical protein